MNTKVKKENKTSTFRQIDTGNCLFALNLAISTEQPNLTP